MLKNEMSIQILIELHDPYIAAHQQRVASVACAIAEAMGLEQKRIGS